MIAHVTPNRMSVPPPRVVEDGHVSASTRATRTPPAPAYVAKVILAAIAIMMTATLVVAAPPTVTIPIAAVLTSGVVVSTLVARSGRRRLARPYPRHANVWSAESSMPGHRSIPGASDGHDPHAPTRAGAGNPAGNRGAVGAWGALGALSVALLLLALAVGERMGAVLAASGLAALAIFRVAATYGGWFRRGSILA